MGCGSSRAVAPAPPVEVTASGDRPAATDDDGDVADDAADGQPVESSAPRLLQRRRSGTGKLRWSDDIGHPDEATPADLPVSSTKPLGLPPPAVSASFDFEDQNNWIADDEVDDSFNSKRS